MKKKVLNISLWLLFGTGVLFLMSFVNSRQNEIKVSHSQLVFEIKRSGEDGFLNEELLQKYISIQVGQKINGTNINDISLSDLESYLSKLAEVKHVEVYRSIDGHLFVEVTEREPIVRVFHENGMSNYIDQDGMYMPLSNSYTAHLPVVTGHVNESDFRGGIKDITMNDDLRFKEIFKMADFVHKSTFWNAQIQEIYVNENGEFELIPRVGDHRIIFGKPEKIERKFQKLEIFYQEGLNNTGWNQFDTINIKYKNQIVCS